MSVAIRANVRRGREAPVMYSWKEEFGAWLLVMIVICLCYWAYIHFNKPAVDTPVVKERKVMV